MSKHDLKDVKNNSESLFSKIRLFFSKIAVLVALIAIFYRNKDEIRDWFDSTPKEIIEEEKRKESVLQALLSIERNWVRKTENPTAFVGFGSCLDIFTSASELFAAMNYTEFPEPKEFGVLKSQNEFLSEFGYYFQQGAAAERYVSDRELFEKLVEESLKLKTTRTAIGGNAPVIANRMAREGAKVVLGGQESDDMKEFNLHDRLKSSGPKVKSADIHLIIEYDKNESFGENLKSTRANRFIVHADQYNPVLAAHDSFKMLFDDADKPDILVVGGLQMMEGYPYEQSDREIYFKKISSLMASAAPEVKTHFELASFVDETIMSSIKEHVLPYSESIGMNEQELPNLLSLMKTGKAISVAPAYPRVASVLDQMREIYELSKKENWTRPLNRMHVHNIAFQAIMVRKESGWRKTMTATAFSALTAHRHVCQTDQINLKNTKLLMDDSFSRSVVGMAEGRVHLNPERPVSCWEETVAGDQLKFCVSPVLVCTKVKQTAGGGDNITGAGLYAQI